MFSPTGWDSTAWGNDPGIGLPVVMHLPQSLSETQLISCLEAVESFSRPATVAAGVLGEILSDVFGWRFG